MVFFFFLVDFFVNTFDSVLDSNELKFLVLISESATNRIYLEKSICQIVILCNLSQFVDLLSKFSGVNFHSFGVRFTPEKLES